MLKLRVFAQVEELSAREGVVYALAVEVTA
ncbi:hypothetical protein HNR36_000690 [Ureibacillus thermosphaericus]|uniref:Uncharacterized protein n=1 Tax=Ureibacillus thermosphaericus TaxID=51173 RepID=A0A840PT04_URETH|nr:hypothetical protein [Ureibacillus thermosphaericus]